MVTYYVFMTDQCKADAAKHNVTKEIDKLAQKLESEQNDRGLDHYPPPYRKKVLGKPGRLVIEEHRSHEDIVLCFARYFIRGSSEYEAFYKDTQGYYQRNKVPKEDIETFLKIRKHKPIKTKPPLSDAELSYLQSTTAHHYTDEGAFLESYDWFERISQGWAKDYLSRYYDLIIEIENGKLSDEATSVVHEKNSSIRILFRHFPEHKRTFLISPIDTRKDSDELELRERYQDVLSNDTLDIDDLIRRSRRAYPAIITYDEDIWVLVEKSVEANLALSPEEESILESVMTHRSDGRKYPLFINGRPGSGKSTILQYLFADHLARFVELNGGSCEQQPPLYLTYSTPLLEQARSAVENILTCGMRNIDSIKSRGYEDGVDWLLKSCLRNLREFLRSLLDQESREQFAHANYVDFDRFRKLWDRKRYKHPIQEVRAIGGELAWHAIRTFIKGMQHESGLVVDPEYYSLELSRDRKSISDHTFEVIFEQIWEKWYEPLCEENGYWDDQDLARAVLAHSGESISRYPAVFCDEAQDFTTIELELIQQLSVYSKRQVPGFLVKHVPFAFAGDPFQTLNPTGFNWNVMQSSFHDNIVQQLDPDGTAKLEFNFQELAFNYRSSEHIVKLGNLVQLLRAVLLRIKGLKPQHSWTRRATVSPVWFRRNDASCQSAIRNQEELVIIIPCGENGEVEYVDGDPFLKSVAIRNGQISRNILSSARAKGLEYDRVLLYGFGDEAVSRLPDLLDHIKNPREEPPEIEKRLAWEYFLSQFYVAVSRARKRLFIVDSDGALENYWSFTDTSKQKELLELYQHPNDWGLEELGGTVKGDTRSWEDDRDDPLELALQWQSQGRAQRDPYLLRLAKDNFIRANRPEDARLCEAEQYEHEGEFRKAAKLFSQLRQPNNASRCYWADNDTNSIAGLAKEFPEIIACPRFIAASAINRDRNTAPQIDNVLTALEKVEPAPFPDMPGEIDAWRWFFSRFITKLGAAIELSDRGKSDWRPYVHRLITTITRLELPLNSYSEIARLFCLVGEPKAALDHWTKCCGQRKPDPKNESWLIRARAETESYPENLRSFHELGDYQSVIDKWRAAGGIVEKELPVNLLLDSATKLSDLGAIREILPASDDFARVSGALDSIDRESIGTLAGAIPVAISHCLEARGDWGKLVSFASNPSTADRKLNSLIRDSGIKWPNEVLIASVVRAMARSDRLASERAKSQKEVSDFLKNSLIIEKDATREKQDVVKAVHKLISVPEIGAAFERAFRLTYALEYYEQFFTKGYLSQRMLSPKKEQVEFAKGRWILCKRRLADMQEGKNREKHEMEARQSEHEWGIAVDNEPEYPMLEAIRGLQIDAIAKSSKKSERVVKPFSPPDGVDSGSPRSHDKHQVLVASTMKVDGRNLSAEVLTRKRRVILTDLESEDQVVCGPRTVTSDDLEVESVDGAKKIRVWLIREWNLLCEIEYRENGSIIRFRITDGPSVVGFELLD